MKNNEIEFIFEYNSSVNAPTFLEATEKLVGININAKLKMHKNANSKCTILAKHRL